MGDASVMVAEAAGEVPPTVGRRRMLFRHHHWCAIMIDIKMKEGIPRRQPKATVDDPYAKPWVARDAAKNAVRQALASGQTPHDLIAQMHGISRPDYTAVVSRLVGAQPPQGIAPDEIEVTGFAREGVIFPLAEIWQEVTGEPMPEVQAPLVSAKPAKRTRTKPPPP